MRASKTFRTPIELCPSCGATLDAVTDVSTKTPARAPKPGDLTVCRYCTLICVFEANGIRPLSAPELGALEPELRHALFLWRRRFTLDPRPPPRGTRQ